MGFQVYIYNCIYFVCVICIMYIYICAYQLVQRISSINRIAGFLNQKNGKKTSPKPEFFVQGITGFTRFTALLHLFLYVWSTYPPLTYQPLRNKDIIASLKGNQWLISPDHKAIFLGGGGTWVAGLQDFRPLLSPRSHQTRTCL